MNVKNDEGRVLEVTGSDQAFEYKKALLFPIQLLLQDQKFQDNYF